MRLQSVGKQRGGAHAPSQRLECIAQWRWIFALDALAINPYE